MPTIPQLPPAGPINAADQVPISQAGVTRAASVGALLSGTQPAISAPSGSLLGRTSLGPGGPEAVALGAGLSMAGGVLTATGADPSGFPVQTTLQLSDEVVLTSADSPRRMPVAVLRGLFSAGQNVTIDQAGTISAVGTGTAAGTAGPPGPVGPQGPMGPQGVPGAPGPQGTPGPGGPRGPGALSGVGNPSNAVGADGDTYVNTATGDVFARAGGNWSRTGNLAGPQGPTGASGLAGVAGPAGPTGPAGPQGLPGAAGPQGPAGAAGAQGPAGSSTSITSAAQVTSIGASDLVGISQAGVDRAITYQNLLNGKLITDQPPSAVSMSGSDVFWLGQNNSPVMVVGTLQQVSDYINGRQAGYPRRRVEEIGSVGLTFASHNRAIVTLPNGGTVSVGQFNDCRDGFECVVVNTSSAGTVIFGSGIVSTGLSTLAPGQSAQVFAIQNSNNAQGVYAQTPSSGTVPSISIGTIGNQVASASFPVAGALLNYSAAPSLQYSDNGGSTWNALPSGALVSATSFSFAHPGMPAQSGQTILISDGVTPAKQSNSFNVAVATIVAPASVLGGQGVNVTLTLAGITTAYLVWMSGTTEVGPRVPISGTSGTVTAPAAAGSYVLAVYDTSVPGSGNNLRTSGTVTVVVPIITVQTPVNTPAKNPLAVSGTYANFTPSALDWSVNGTTWQAAGAPVISGGAFSFTAPANTIPAGGPYTLLVRDRSTLTQGASPGSFSAYGGAIGTMPTPVAGSAVTVGLTLTAITTAYLVWMQGTTEIGSRIAVSGSSATIAAPSSSGSYTLALYDTAAGATGTQLDGKAVTVGAGVAADGNLTAFGIASPIAFFDAGNPQAVYGDSGFSVIQSANSGVVRGLRDTSGSGRDLYQPNSNAPTLSLGVTSTGRSGLRFVGTSSQLLKQLPSATWMGSMQTGPITVLAVFKLLTDANSGSPYMVVGAGSSANADVRNSFSINASTTGSPSVQSARHSPTATFSNKDTSLGAGAKGTLLKVVGRWDPNSGQLNVLVNAGPGPATTSTTGPYTGNAWDSFFLGGLPGVPSLVFDGYVFEVDVWNTYVSATVAAQLVTYATNKWGS